MAAPQVFAAIAGVAAAASLMAVGTSSEASHDVATSSTSGQLVGADGLALDSTSATDVVALGFAPVDISADLAEIRRSESTGGTGGSAASAAACADEPVTADALNLEFDQGIDKMVGADYQRAFELDDERVLWVFQDVFVDDGIGDPTLVHNAAVVQDGMCFDSVVGGIEQQPDSWVAEVDTQPFQHWYWPLDGYQRDADTFVLYLAEMEERGSGYLDNATPVATWTVVIDLATLVRGELERAPNPNDELYGFEITTDDDYLYLYAQCHRQFGFSLLGHDDCAADVYIARQPLDEPSRPLEYWNGTEWTRNSRTAANIAPVAGLDGAARVANPMQIERDRDRWIAVTKAGDWWGDIVYFDVAPSPEGPWTTTAAFPVATQGEPDEVAAYFVSFVPSDDNGRTLAISNNRWDGEFSDIYHPRFTTMPDRVWDEREPVNVGGDVWLPTGAPTDR